MHGYGYDHSLISPFLDERQRRLYLAAEAKAIGYGCVSTVSRATGVSRSVISAGYDDFNEAKEEKASAGRIRREGGGRKETVETDITLKADFEALIEPLTSGDPESPLRWTCKSVHNLSDELNRMGHKTSHRMVAELLHEMDYSLQANRKTLEGESHPDRNVQFEFINERVNELQSMGQPVISVDTKKKELVGDFKNGGKELRPKGNPEKVRVHDFKIPALGRVAPYGVYDITHNIGWVNVGIDHDTSTFAVESIRRWWDSMGQVLYPDARHLMVTADGGRSNGYRIKLWKVELQKLANETGLSIQVCHFPPGTSK